MRHLVTMSGPFILLSVAFLIIAVLAPEIILFGAILSLGTLPLLLLVSSIAIPICARYVFDVGTPNTPPTRLMVMTAIALDIVVLAGAVAFSYSSLDEAIRFAIGV